jgi:hypothetical protein
MMSINQIYENLKRMKMDGVHILFHKSIISIQIGNNYEVIIELCKKSRANMYLIGYRLPINEKVIEVRTQIIDCSEKLGIEIDAKAPFYDYLFRTLVKRHQGIIHKMNKVMVLYTRNAEGNFDTHTVSYDEDLHTYVISSPKRLLEEFISISKLDKNVKESYLS